MTIGKKIFKAFLRIFVVLFILFIGLEIADYVCKKKLESEVDIYENGYVNELIGDKLTVGYCDTAHEDFVLLRKDDEVPKKKKDKKRILIVGDSFIWGFANRNMNTLLWTRLEYLLKKEGYNDVEVFAAGSCGIGTIDEVNLILHNDKTIEKIDPDLIILGLVFNDLDIDNDADPDYLPGFDEQKYINDHYDNFLMRFINNHFPSLYEKLINTLIVKKTSEPNFYKENGPIYGYSFDAKEVEYRTDKYKQLYIDRGLKEVKAMKIPTIFYELYIGYTYDYELEFMNFVRDKCKELGIKYYSNVRDEVTYIAYERPEIDLTQNGGDGHPSEYLNDIFARDILKTLKKDFKKVLGKKTKVKKFKLDINDYLPYDINLVKVNDNTYRFVWPDKLLTFPLDQKYIKLNLKYPIKVRNVKITSTNADNIDLWYNRYMEDKVFNKVNGRNFVYNINDEVFSINLHLDKQDINSSSEVVIEFKL